ncbi:MAG: bactofilin family protein [Candidatus Polarisedimenticolia bacterium]
MLFRKRHDAEAGDGQTPSPGGNGGGTEPREASFVRLPGGGRSVVGSQTRISGTLRGEGSILVRGSVDGTLSLGGGLTVAPEGRLRADVEAGTVDLLGEAQGSIVATTRVALSETGRFEGRLTTPILDLRPGAVLRGTARIAGLPGRDRGGLSH